MNFISFSEFTFRAESALAIFCCTADHLPKAEIGSPGAVRTGAIQDKLQ